MGNLWQMDCENASQRGIKNVGMLLLVERRSGENLALRY